MHRFIFFTFLAVLSLGCLSTVADAQTSIAVVDVERALNEAKVAKSLNKKRADAREAFLAKLSKQEQALRDEGKTLFAKRKDLSEEEFQKQQQEYEEKLIGVRKMTQKQRREFEQASNAALDKLKDHLASSVKKIAQDKGYGLVISNRDVIAGENSLDITDQTIKAMDSEKIQIPFNVE